MRMHKMLVYGAVGCQPTVYLQIVASFDEVDDNELKEWMLSYELQGR